jgi:hypothetical protein
MMSLLGRVAPYLLITALIVFADRERSAIRKLTRDGVRGKHAHTFSKRTSGSRPPPQIYELGVVASK